MPHMQPEVFKGDGWIVETDDGTVVAPDIDAPDADDLRKAIGSGRRVQIGDVYGHVEAVTYVKGWFGRYSAPGYLDATPWLFSKNKRELLKDLREYYGSNPPLSSAQRGKRSRAKMARTVAKHGLLSPEAVALRQRMDARAKRRRRGRTVLRRQAKRGRRRTLSNPTTITVKLSRIGGFVDQIRYQDVNDRKYYKHDGEDANTIMYLAEHHSFGRCLMIVNADAKPLWEDA